MKSSSRALFGALLITLSIGGVVVLRSSSGPAQAASTTAQPAAFRAELLDLAFQAGSALPSNPHVKNRSRLQEDVAEAFLAVGEPQRAFTAAKAIENWRRGTALANVALWRAKHADAREAERCIELARAVLASPENEAAESDTTQGWRKERIRARLARACLALGKQAEAAELQQGLAPAESGAVLAEEAALTEPAAFDARLAQQAAELATGDFDRGRAALEACKGLFERFYADADRRARIEQVIHAGWTKLPLQVRIELLLELSGSATEHGDSAHALALLGEARTLFESAEWLAQDRIPLQAKLAACRGRAGETEAARADVAAALALFESERARIVDIYRAAPLRALAEADMELGDEDAARAAYARALEEGVANPNSRPRAEDLCATCCSMASHGFEPDAQLWKRLREIVAGLKAPW